MTGVEMYNSRFVPSFATRRNFVAMSLLFAAAACVRPGEGGKTLRVGLVDPCKEDGRGVGEAYISFVEQAGFESVVLRRTEDKSKIAEMVASCDMIVLCGGEDVEPARYGEKESPKLGKVNKVRDAWEWALLDESVKMRKPILGICRGCQMLNVYFGGTLWQDLPSEFEGCAREGHRLENQGEHSIIVVPGSRFATVAGSLKTNVNSRHHQAVKKLGRGFKATAHSLDGVIEVIENTEYPAIGVQFHPENLVCSKNRKEFLNLLPSYGK
jgi:putative glutamine amidotransferase